MERLDVDVKKPSNVLSVVSVILLAPYSQLQSYSCIVNFVRKMKQAAGRPLVIYHQKYVLAPRSSRIESPSPNLSCLSPISSPFFLGLAYHWVENRTGQAAAKVHFDILVRTVTSSSLEYNAAAASGASIGSEPCQRRVLLCATNPYFNLKLHRKRELSTTTACTKTFFGGSSPSLSLLT